MQPLSKARARAAVKENVLSAFPHLWAFQSPFCPCFHYDCGYGSAGCSFVPSAAPL
ncbi:hypothetical protein VFPFJ_00664 [Purpureocillium lilacinum]|uniref:Uncharacterized protein n=1 Tax=Purpureocillium lilacinum TaxID=33203 RepID=A0A179HAR6_PURLI|nr:hypothetical protein VFPFJ_00664 [Purpureocillium lilacinum]OAQ86593.1 hypothetical protein VFPBJ_00633 [Purpureocillium lilacinum]OAQ94555.1 hypothetical protein VFPFJ_00664 [Purpureocillium lilacinum]